jgi:hypothetical protein
MTQIILECSTLPDTGPIAIQVDYAGEIKVKAEAARRKANAYLLTTVTNLSYAGHESGLVFGEHLVWRFPAMLALPSYGEIGPIGTIDVDAASGDTRSVPLSPTLISQMQERANALARRLPHKAAPRIR